MEIVADNYIAVSLNFHSIKINIIAQTCFWCNVAFTIYLEVIAIAFSNSFTSMKI